MKMKKGFTLTEVIIACGVLSLFVGAVMTLYSNGSKISNSTMWLQNTTNRLRNATRLITETIRRASYPTKINYPQEIVQSDKDCFKVQYYDGILTSANCSSGRNFLVVAECKPVKKGVEVGKKDEDGEIKFHVFSLAKNGDLTYASYAETITDVNTGLSKPIPSGKKGSVIVTDVESIKCAKKGDSKKKIAPIEITINCAMPRHTLTKRSETAVGAPTVEVANTLK